MKSSKQVNSKRCFVLESNKSDPFFKKSVRNYISSKRVCDLNQLVLNVIEQKYASHPFRRKIISNEFFLKKEGSRLFDSTTKHLFEFTCLLLFIEFLQRVCFLV